VKLFSHILVLTLSTLAFTANAGLIENGGFDDVSHDYQGTIKNRYLDELSDTLNWDVFQGIPGWSVISGSGVEVLHTGANTGGLAGDADDVKAQTESLFIELDLDQSNNFDHNSAIAQTVEDLLVGSSYEISFYYQPRTSSEDDNGINLHVFEGDLGKFSGSTPEEFNKEDNILLSVDSNTAIWNDLAWKKFSTVFVATKEKMSIAFAGFGTSNGQGGFIDTVDLVKVPEPSAFLLLLLGLCGIANRKK